jgi:putative transposase
MPRANRHFLPDHVWHITHRCFRREYLLKFARVLRRCCLFAASGQLVTL